VFFKNKFVGSALVILSIISLLLLPVPFIKIAPGPLFNTVGKVNKIEIINISGVKTYESKGELNFTTVSETGGPYGRLALVDAVSSWLSPTEAVVPAADLYPENLDPELIKKENAKAFTSSQTNAIAAALTYLKIPVEATVVIESVVVGSASDGIIEPGDLILEVDENIIKTSADVVKFVQQKKPKDEISIKLNRSNVEKIVKVVAQELKSDITKASIGVSIGPGIQPPYDFKFGVQAVGGPSAGLMLSLGILDELTPDDLTKGKIIAGTGTINYLGEVGPIGGIRQKLAGAHKAGAQIFLAPIDNCVEIKASDYKGMPIIAVRNFADAVIAINVFTRGASLSELDNCQEKKAI
jgi:PDZ domain-containing protein